MSSTDYGRNDSVTFIKSQIPQVFKDSKTTVCNNKFMAGLCATTPEPGMFDYPALLNVMPEAIKTNPKYTQPENSYVAPPTQTLNPAASKKIETIDLTNKTISSTTSSKVKPSLYDIDPNSLTNVTPSPFNKVSDVAIDPEIGTITTPKVKPSDYDVDPKKVAAELKEKQMAKAMKKEDMGFLRNS